MNDFIGVIENNTTTFNRDITITDLEKNSKVIVKCYCTIVKGKSMSYYLDIVEKELYMQNQAAIQAEVDKWVAEAKTTARKLEVPFII